MYSSYLKIDNDWDRYYDKTFGSFFFYITFALTVMYAILFVKCLKNSYSV